MFCTAQFKIGKFYQVVRVGTKGILVGFSNIAKPGNHKPDLDDELGVYHCKEGLIGFSKGYRDHGVLSQLRESNFKS